jgi:glycosyltransferase involved in cell wall biosynthesis
MRIHWLSNAPWANTGYGNQTKLFTPRIKDLGHEVSITAFYGLQGGRIIGSHDIPIYGNAGHPYGQDVMVPNAVAEGAQIIITLLDSWVVEPQRFNGAPVVWVPWFPVDSEPCKPADIAGVKQAHARIVFSHFAESEMQKAGLDCYYVPHGVDSQAFHPQDMKRSRKMLTWSQDRFIVGMVAANKGFPCRKAFFEQLTAFAAFHKSHPDALLYMHTDDGAHESRLGVNLPEFLDILGLKYDYMRQQPISPSTAVIFCDQYTYASTGYNDEYMNAAYNGMDVHMLVSMGEGFGIPILEAQAAGCPVLVGDWTAMSELCFGGWKVAKRDATPSWMPQYHTFQFSPHPEAIAEKLEQAYRMRGNYDYRERARDGAVKYDADRITQKYWKPVLEKIEQSLAPVVLPAGVPVGDLVGQEVSA